MIFEIPKNIDIAYRDTNFEVPLLKNIDIEYRDTKCFLLTTLNFSCPSTSTTDTSTNSTEYLPVC